MLCVCVCVAPELEVIVSEETEIGEEEEENGPEDETDFSRVSSKSLTPSLSLSVKLCFVVDESLI